MNNFVTNKSKLPQYGAQVFPCVWNHSTLGAESEIMALGSLVSESFLAYQFLLYTKCLGGKEDWNLES